MEVSICLSVEPSACLHDEIVHVTTRGLKPCQCVTLKSKATDIRGTEFFAYAHYKADESGLVDVSEHESEGGHYSGVFPMGLIGCLQPSPLEYKFMRFFKRDIETPLKVTFSVYDGHLSVDELYLGSCPSPLDSKVHLRYYMAPGVKRIPVREGKLRATLFLPSGGGPFPGVVDMFGTAGGLLEFRAAQMASRGIAALALAYFDYDDLPTKVTEFELSYFQCAVDYLLKHEKVQKPSVGVIGVSKGADVALSMASYIPSPAIGAVVWINGCCSPMGFGLKLPDGTSITPLDFNYDSMTIEEGELFNILGGSCPPEDYPDSVIPVENSKASFLFLVSLDDRNVNSLMYARASIQRLKDAGKNKYDLVTFPGAGHLLEPPFSPHAHATYHKHFRVPIIWGGNAREHTAAQRYAWAITLSFLKRTLAAKRSKL